MKRSPLKIRVRIRSLDGPVVSLIGRDAWASQLEKADLRGCTPIDHPGPWSFYVHKLRKAGFSIETVTEAHGGPFAGKHARCVLRSETTVIEDREVQA
jgi:winged helix domain-containing protein